MNPSKLHLSEEESAMVQDSHWLLTKNSIMLKSAELLGVLAAWLQEAFVKADVSGNPVLQLSPKIAKGENYNGLPYMMLDYPRFFAKDEIYAWRTMFWWGNFISVTWHLRGEQLERNRNNIVNAYQQIAHANFRLCIGEDEWRHDFGADNYIPVSSISAELFAKELSDKPFCKLAVKLSLDQWNNAKEKLTDVYGLLLEIGGFSFQGGETGL
ncbi:MAG: hypothetical protein EOO02_04905 [Chitinophagaceae bacterium]|nr:MAG: hypothetical protein EOO02_04905 [Chitinophagaceae bacterium]